uniref:cellulase n=2 Tax=Aegilops tauschii TaxID=37682 RepID=A0A453PSL5_AEGTS
MATKRQVYADFITHEAISSSVAEFSWDLKYPGAQILLAQHNMTASGGMQSYKTQADNFVCAVLPDTPFHQVFITPGSMIHLRDGANSQYVTGTVFLFLVYANWLDSARQDVMCGAMPIKRQGQGVRQAADGLPPGGQPEGRSYIVGFGANPPTQPHHRGASTPVLKPGTVVNCGMSFGDWFALDRGRQLHRQAQRVGVHRALHLHQLPRHRRAPPRAQPRRLPLPVPVDVDF